MKISTKELENKIDKAESVDELREILKTLPRVSFGNRLYELCDKYGVTPSKLQSDCGITKSHFYNFLNGTRVPKKHHIIKMGLYLKLTEEEINELLKLANHKELYSKRKEDAIILFGIKNGKSIAEIDELLVEQNSTFTLSEK